MLACTFNVFKMSSMTNRPENIPTSSELTSATQEFLSKIHDFAPEVLEGFTARFEEPSTIHRRVYDNRFRCNIIPSEDHSAPPTIALFHGSSPIWHEKDIYTFSKKSQCYWKKHVDVEPGMYETTEPDEYNRDPVKASAIELGRVLGVLEFLVRKVELRVPIANYTTTHRTLGRRLLSMFG